MATFVATNGNSWGKAAGCGRTFPEAEEGAPLVGHLEQHAVGAVPGEALTTQVCKLRQRGRLGYDVTA